MRVTAVFGTRPEVVKLAPLLWAMQGEVRTIHTGQHSSEAMSRGLWSQLEIGQPDVILEIDASERGGRLGTTVASVGDVLDAQRPDVVVVQGDTDSTVAGALAANAAGIPIAHVEAGLRSYDLAMPEERNRVVVDHLAQLCCAPTEVSHRQLVAEGIPADRVVVTGNTVVDAALRMLPGPDRCADMALRYGVEPGHFLLATFHRQENVDDEANLRSIVRELAAMPLPVVMPLHPRTAARANALGLELERGALRPVEPTGYEEFLALERASAALVTDSGGVQEEASIVKRRVLVVRTSTERPEISGSFATLAPPRSTFHEIVAEWIAQGTTRSASLEEAPCPFGDGTSGKRVAEAIRALALAS